MMDDVRVPAADLAHGRRMAEGDCPGFDRLTADEQVIVAALWSDTFADAFVADTWTSLRLTGGGIVVADSSAGSADTMTTVTFVGDHLVFGDRRLFDPDVIDVTFGDTEDWID